MGGMRVTLVIGKLVMNAVGGHPEDRSAFQGECAADGQEILQPLGRAVAAMREQAMIAHADTHVDGEYPERDETEESLPGKHEEGGHGEDMKGHHEAGGHPVGLVGLGVAAQNRHVIVLFCGPRRSGAFPAGFGRRNKRYGGGGFYEFGRHDLGRALSLCPVKLNLTGPRLSVRKSFVMTISHTYDSAVCIGIRALGGLMVANFLRLSSRPGSASPDGCVAGPSGSAPEPDHRLAHQQGTGGAGAWVTANAEQPAHDRGCLP